MWETPHRALSYVIYPKKHVSVFVFVMDPVPACVIARSLLRPANLFSLLVFEVHTKTTAFFSPLPLSECAIAAVTMLLACVAYSCQEDGGALSPRLSPRTPAAERITKPSPRRHDLVAPP